MPNAPEKRKVSNLSKSFTTSVSTYGTNASANSRVVPTVLSFFSSAFIMKLMIFSISPSFINPSMNHSMARWLPIII